MDRLGELLLGCSGWSYDEWVGPFYESTERKFTQYARVFRTTEINSTFYRFPDSSLALGLARSSPRDFVFTAKMPQVITHEKMLDLDRGVENDVRRFLNVMRILNDVGKLGCLLVQLPPSLSFQEFQRLDRFLGSLPGEFRFAFEFRHKSWVDEGVREKTFSLLEEHRAAYVVVDEPLLPPILGVTTDFSYVRWHGHGRDPWFNYQYSDGELRSWVPRLDALRSEAPKVLGYFNNHYHGYAPRNCLSMMQMMGEASSEQVRIKERIAGYLQRHPPDSRNSYSENKPRS